MGNEAAWPVDSDLNRPKTLKPWPKGVSGNPRGRPRKDVRLHDVRALARQHGPDVLQKLVAFMDHKDPRVAVRACEAILDRAYGRPAPEVVAAFTGPVLIKWQQEASSEAPPRTVSSPPALGPTGVSFTPDSNGGAHPAASDRKHTKALTGPGL
jgi:hypothetical protein